MNTELLAPVGSFDALKAAVQNGANAVYLGGKEFSARASANNFDREELKEAVKYAHIRNVKVFVTANTLIKQYEIDDFLNYIKYLYDIDVDAVILQDIGMAKLIKSLLPDFELHASTQMVAHSLEDTLYLQNIGFDRVVLARELNIDEIEYICKNTDVDIEIFVHGALCVCYSGQCLMSSMIGNRSGNRGRCAQPCRQKYELIDINSGKVIDTEGDYLLSPRDLNTIEEIDRVIEAGVHSLKIEGRM
ncbi:U32 family peptidase, partial [Acinetobacter sp. RIT592]